MSVGCCSSELTSSVKSCFTLLHAGLGITSIVIASIAIAGILPGPTASAVILETCIGYTSLGFLIVGKHRAKYIPLFMLTTLPIFVCSAMGLAGALTAFQVGWAHIGTSLVAFPVSCYYHSSMTRRINTTGI